MDEDAKQMTRHVRMTKACENAVRQEPHMYSPLSLVAAKS
jgi:hypothetical protein